MQIKNVALDPNKTQKLFDGGGLFLEVTKTGSKRWRLKYRHSGKEKLISFGTFPLVGLKEAREKRDDAKRLLLDGVDPSANRQAIKKSEYAETQNTFIAVGTEWVDQNRDTWASTHTRTIDQRLKNDVFPYIGKLSITEISPSDLISLLRRIEARGAIETAHRVRICLGQIFRYGVATGRLLSDPSRDLRGALRPVKVTHLAAVTEPMRVGELLRMMDAYGGGKVVQAALRIAPLVFVRPGELRKAEWNDINLETREWRFNASKTKEPHIVPLSTQAVDALKDIQILTGNCRFVFPSPRTSERPMSENAVLAALRSLGIPKEEMCGHGFRAMARTMLDEILGIPPHFIEQQLAHKVKDTLGRAYNRTKHLPERQDMMQKWADYLDELRVAPAKSSLKYENEVALGSLS